MAEHVYDNLVLAHLEICGLGRTWKCEYFGDMLAFETGTGG